MIQNFNAYDTVKLTDSFVAQVDKKDDDGNVITDANGDNVKEDLTVKPKRSPRGRLLRSLRSRC